MSLIKASIRDSQDKDIRRKLEKSEPMKEFYSSPHSSDRETTATFTTDDNDTVKVDRKTGRVTIKNY